MKRLVVLGLIALVFFANLLLEFSKVSAATASFYTTGGGSVYTGSEINVTVYANSSDTYNAVSVDISYSNLTFLGASVASGWTGVSGPSNSGNTVSYSGALLGSTASGSKAVLNLSFRAPYSSNQSSISSSGTIALADGNGTKVSGGGNIVTYSIVEPPPPPKPAPDAVNITSTSHPSQDDWYNKTQVDLSWNKEDEVDGFSYELNTTADTTPDDTSDSTDTSKSFENLNNGSNYFHIKAHNSIGWSDTSHYKVNVDIRNPDPFTITKITRDSKNLIYFVTNDQPSGIKEYTLKLDDKDIGKQSSGYEISDSTSKVEVVAVDKAGNKATSTLTLKAATNPISEDISQTKQNEQSVLKTILLTLLVMLTIEGLVAASIFIYKKYGKRK